LSGNLQRQSNLIYSAALFVFGWSKMLGDLQGISAERDKLGRYKPGYNSRRVKQERIAAKLNELTAEFFPDNGYSRMDAARLKLAAQHYVDAETCRDPVTRHRATRCAEYLLSKLKPPPAPRSAPALETARAMLERLGKGDPSAV
jgi:hypothetical protein